MTGGHLKPDPYNRPFQVLNTYGREAADELTQFESRNLAAVEKFIQREEVDCDYVHTTAIDVFIRDQDWAAALVKVESLRKAGIGSAADLITSSSKEEAERVSTQHHFLRTRLIASLGFPSERRQGLSVVRGRTLVPIRACP